MTKVELVRSYPYKIRTYQVGGTGRILLHHLFNLLQDVAHRDAMAFGFGFPHLLEVEKFWVLSRMTVELDYMPSYDDEIQIQTWVKSVSGPKSEREFTIKFNNEIIIRATGLFYCLSVSDHRPSAIPLAEKLQRLVHNESAVMGGAERVVSGDNDSEWQSKNSFKARHSDIDLLNHVNNASYVKWLMDETRLYHPDALVARFSINYLNEVRLGENIEVRHTEEANNDLIHEIINIESGKVVCKSRTVWQKA